MTSARHCSIDLESTPYYHLVSRCVRRSFLCEEDPVTGKNFDHRKQWLVDRIKTLGDIFSLNVCAYAAMSNHYLCEAPNYVKLSFFILIFSPTLRIYCT